MIWLLISRPHLALGTVYATIEATYYADKNFTESHGLDNRANGYKHALWNMLIAYYVQGFYSSSQDALAWAKRITDMHEICFQNHAAAMDMDLKNNELGRALYHSLYGKKQKRPSKPSLLNSLWDNRDQIITLNNKI